MSGGVAIVLAAIGLVLIIAAIRGTYPDLTTILLHPPTAPKGSDRATLLPPDTSGGTGGGGSHGGVR